MTQWNSTVSGTRSKHSPDVSHKIKLCCTRTRKRDCRIDYLVAFKRISCVYSSRYNIGALPRFKFEDSLRCKLNGLFYSKDKRIFCMNGDGNLKTLQLGRIFKLDIVLLL